MVELGKARLMEALKKTRSTRRARVGLVLWSRCDGRTTFELPWCGC
jgi:hypothetical protein